MNEGDALDFYDDVVGGNDGATVDQSVEYVLEAANGRELTVTLEPIDRKFVIDQLNKLPSEMLELFSEVDDPDEAQEMAEEQNALSGLSGEAIGAFEDICAESMEHGKLTQHHFDDLVQELSLEVVFEMGAEVIEMSLDDDGAITGFRERN